jgi:hypothetical protein
MKLACQLAAALVLVCSILSCSQHASNEQYVSQKIPIRLQGTNPVTFEIHSLSGNGAQDVGIRCSNEDWSALTNSARKISVRLKSSDRKGTEIYLGPPYDAPGPLGYMPDVHYLFDIVGQYHAKALVEVTFPNALRETTLAQIIVSKTPADGGP